MPIEYDNITSFESIKISLSISNQDMVDSLRKTIHRIYSITLCVEKFEQSGTTLGKYHDALGFLNETDRTQAYKYDDVMVAEKIFEEMTLRINEFSNSSTTNNDISYVTLFLDFPGTHEIANILAHDLNIHWATLRGDTMDDGDKLFVVSWFPVQEDILSNKHFTTSVRENFHVVFLCNSQAQVANDTTIASIITPQSAFSKTLHQVKMDFTRDRMEDEEKFLHVLYHVSLYPSSPVNGASILPVESLKIIFRQSAYLCYRRINDFLAYINQRSQDQEDHLSITNLEDMVLELLFVIVKYFGLVEYQLQTVCGGTQPCIATKAFACENINPDSLEMTTTLSSSQIGNIFETLKTDSEIVFDRLTVLEMDQRSLGEFLLSENGHHISSRHRGVDTIRKCIKSPDMISSTNPTIWRLHKVLLDMMRTDNKIQDTSEYRRLRWIMEAFYTESSVIVQNNEV